MTEPSTPLMRQYTAIKKEHPIALLFFRLGDFYELFFDDAVLASKELQITLTSRNKEKGIAVPMCGVPYHAAEGYISKLIRKGFKFAICDQMESTKLAKKLVRREVTRVVTPGTAADSSLSSEENNFLAALARVEDRVGFAALDLSTGEFRATEFSGEDAARRIQEELAQLRPTEVLYGSSAPLFDQQRRGNSRLQSNDGLAGCAETPLDDWIFAPDHAIPLLENQFGVLSLEGFGLAGKPAAASAAGAILYYVRSTQRGSLHHVDRVGVLALAASLAKMPAVRDLLARLPAERWRGLHDSVDDLGDVRERIEKAIVPEPPISLSDGGVIQSGVDRELDELRDMSRNSKQYLALIEQRERQRTGIGSLKVKFNSIFGYYLEVSKPNLHLVPPDYERKQTLVNAERFTTPELKEYEAKILDAQEKIVEIERRLFAELRTAIAAEAKRIRRTALALAEVDVLAAFAHIAALRNYCRPKFDDSSDIEILEGRHPVIEQQEVGGGDRFVPNDLYLNSTTHTVLVLTGPNMGGKSTYLRQAALIVILAQMGSFVPARSARLGIVDRVFTRIGASDNLARGRSTFMVEMTETAAILHTATPRSLILLDEIGRGTATYDGLAIAWAAVEYLHARTRAKTLFATHYFELTELAERLSGVKNYHVSVKETGGGIVFLRKVEPGAADRSYGIEVAKLAGLPHEVIERAREVLAEHESAEQQVTGHLSPGAEPAPPQLTIFTPLSQPVLEKLREVDLNRLTPLEALNLLAELKKQVE